jgi:3-hydroxybutyryl-CoA dehydrogenase
MINLTKKSIVGVVGSGAMGSGIAQVAATAKHNVVVFDKSTEALAKAGENLQSGMQKLVEKGKISLNDANEIISNIKFVSDFNDFKDCDIIIEAIVEDLTVKKDLFRTLELLVNDHCVLATNTSSLSVASIASACKISSRVIGIHFFNPATLMPLVEIIPAVQTAKSVTEECRKLIDSWGKTTVLAKDTPGFIVNRLARPFYGEALRIYEEGIADFATIDWAMKELGGFKMGPFELMDFIGNDVNYKVTESVFTAFYFDPRYKPSLTQKSYFDAGWYGRKSGRGYYDYSPNAEKPNPKLDFDLGNSIVMRILVMLINEAADALFLKIATRDDLDMAMTKGVNYPNGLLRWADELGVETVLNYLESMEDLYGEDRYRPSPLLKIKVKDNKSFY